jgi:rhodanese-related sulfurtransferase
VATERQPLVPIAPPIRVTVNELSARAAELIDRIDPGAAADELDGGATLVDIRSLDARQRDGIVPGSLHVPRTVLEWRLDPSCEWRSLHAPALEDRVIVLCDHGYSSVFAAATLNRLGFARACDVIGGFEAWRAAGLPVRLADDAPLADGELPGMRPPAPL